MEDTLNSAGSVRYLQAIIRLQPTEAFTTLLELRKALNGTDGVDSAEVESEEVIVYFDPLRITEQAINSLLRQAGREPAGMELRQTSASPRQFARQDLVGRYA